MEDYMKDDMMHHYRLMLHNHNMRDPIYFEGLLVFPTDDDPYPECPYRFPKELDRKRMIIALKEGDLTEDEKNKLRKYNEEMYKTEYHRWTDGYYSSFKFLFIKTQL